MTSSNLKQFIEISTEKANAEKNKIKRDISEGDFYRKKYLELINILDHKNIEADNQDWQDREAEREAKNKNDADEDSNNARKTLRWVILYIIFGWLVFVGIIILLQGFHVNIYLTKNHIYFDLPVSVINTLLGTTTLSVFGLYKVVINYFFNIKK